MLGEHLAKLFSLSIWSFLVALKTQLYEKRLEKHFKKSFEKRKKGKHLNKSHFKKVICYRLDRVITNRNHENVSGRTLNSQIAVQSITSGLTLLTTRTERALRAGISSRARWPWQIIVATVVATNSNSITGSFIFLPIICPSVKKMSRHVIVELAHHKTSVWRLGVDQRLCSG